jgi:hypothetical protein
MKAHWPVPLLVVSTLVGCASSQRSVGDGAFQKRRLRTGWHVDLGLRREVVRHEHSARLDPLEPATLSVHERPVAEPLASTIPIAPPRQAKAPLKVITTDVLHTGALVRVQELTAPEKTLNTPSNDTIGKWNPWAVPAFVVALGTVAYALLGTSEIIVVLAVVATLVLASIAVRKGRTYEWRGKGFAIAALMIGALAGLITLIALLVG